MLLQFNISQINSSLTRIQLNETNLRSFDENHMLVGGTFSVCKCHAVWRHWQDMGINSEMKELNYQYTLFLKSI